MANFSRKVMMTLVLRFFKFPLYGKHWYLNNINHDKNEESEK